MFSFTDAKGNATTILANGDKTIVQSDGIQITQFGLFDEEGRQFKREFDTADGKAAVTYFQDGRRQLDFHPPRADGTASLVERLQANGPSYEAKILTPPNEVPQRLADTLEVLTEASRTGDRHKELDAVKKLAKLELQSNEAKNNLDGFASRSPENLGLVQYARFNQEGGPTGVLLGSGTLPPAERIEVVRAAAADLSSSFEKGLLTPEQLTLATRGMAFALYDDRSGKAKGTMPVSQQLASILEKSMSGPNRHQTMKAAVEMVGLGVLPTINQLGLADAFVPIVLKGVEASARDGRSWNTVSKQLDEIKQFSKNGNRAALAISNAIADGGDLYWRSPAAVDAPVSSAAVVDLEGDTEKYEPISFKNRNVPNPEDLEKDDSGTERTDSDDPEDAVQPEVFVSAELPDQDKKPVKEKIDTREKAATAVFGDLSSLLAGATDIPEDGKNYKELGFHSKVAGMVSEFLKGNDQAFLDLRTEAGRPEWIPDTSSVAPAAFHRVSVVKAVLELEKAIESGDKEKQKDAMRELAKMRSIKPGSDYQDVHKAIDDYLKVKTEQQPGLIGRDQFNEYRRQSEERLKQSFQQSAGDLAAVLTAPDDKRRQQAIDAFQKSASDNPDSKLLEWSSRLGDFGSTLNLKKQLIAEKPDAKAIQAALQRLETTSPALAKDYFADLLAQLKEDPKTGEQFAKVEKLDVESVKKLLQEGKPDSLLAQLKKSMETGQMQELFAELEALKKSKHSPLDLLKAGVPEQKELDRAIESSNADIRKEEEELRRLERDFLKRGSTQEERDKVIQELRLKAEQSRLTVGAMSGPDAYRLEQLNKVLGLKDTDDPKIAAEYLVALKASRTAGNPHAKELLDKLLTEPQRDHIDDLIKTLQAGGDAGNDALKQLKASTKFVDDELNPMRIENLTSDFKGDKPPTLKDLEALEASLKVERESGNNGADTWLDWCQATKLVIPLKVGSGATKESRIDNIKQLGDLAKNGNDHARKALLAILIDDISPQARGYWNAEFNSQDGPKALHADLPKSVKSDSYDYAAAVVKALTTASDGKADQFGRGDALAFSLAMDHWSDRLIVTNDLENLLKKGINGRNGDAVLAGVFDSLNISASGGERLARTILHGVNQPEFAKHMPAFVRWAEAGDKVGMQILAGVLTGRTDKPDLLKTARETFAKIATDKRCQQPALEALMDAYEQDVKQTDVLKKNV